MTFNEWMISCGHQIRCELHQGGRECNCSALRGEKAIPGNPVCKIPHTGTE